MWLSVLQYLQAGEGGGGGGWVGGCGIPRDIRRGGVHVFMFMCVRVKDAGLS